MDSKYSSENPARSRKEGSDTTYRVAALPGTNFCSSKEAIFSSNLWKDIWFFFQFHLVLLLFAKVVLELGYPPVPLATLGLEIDMTIM